MSQITSTVYGIAPWSAELLRASGDIERGRPLQTGYKDQQSADFGIYSGTLEAAGIDYRSGDWGGGTEDYLRDVVRLFSGFSGNPNKGEMTRWFDTNTFYRQPVLDGFPEQKEPYPHATYLDWLELQGSTGTYQPTFLSPYAFAKLAGKADHIPDKNALALSVALYSQLLAEANEQGIKNVLFHEPFIPYVGSPPEERAAFIEHIRMFTEFYTDIQIGLFFSYGDGAAVINDILAEDLPVAAIGADLKKTPLDKIGPVGKRVFLAGLIDGANTLYEPDNLLAARLQETAALQNCGPVSLTHSVDLEHLPRRHALHKILQIGRVAALAREEDVR